MQFNNSTQQKMKTKNMTTPTENPLTRRIPKEGKIMSKSTLKLLPALMIAITAAFVTTRPVCAGVIEPTLTLTEVSNTQLNWAWDAAGGSSSGSITAGSTDQWPQTLISGPGLPGIPVGSSVRPLIFWTEPEDAGFRNEIRINYTQITSSSFTWTVAVNSDFLTTGGGNNPNGSVLDVNGRFKVGFDDNAATSETAVPDTGTTFSLFGLSLTGLGFLRRKLC